MRDHNHVLQGDTLGCPACDWREARVTPPAGAPGQVYPALTEAEFARGCAEFGGIRFVEDEDGRYLFAYGHIAPTLFAMAMTGWDRSLGSTEEPYTAEQVQHRWAVRTSETVDDWLISWADRYQDHEDRFPLTVITR